MRVRKTGDVGRTPAPTGQPSLHQSPAEDPAPGDEGRKKARVSPVPPGQRATEGPLGACPLWVPALRPLQGTLVRPFPRCTIEAVWEGVSPGTKTCLPACATPYAELTHPDAEADCQRQAGRAVRAQREHCHVPAVHAHGGQGGARGLHRDSGKNGIPACGPLPRQGLSLSAPPCGSPTVQPLSTGRTWTPGRSPGPQFEGAGERGAREGPQDGGGGGAFG